MEKRKTSGKGKRAEQAGAGAQDCRCKEVSRKTPAELFKIMLGDLAFWKKKTKS